jgi:PPK2 family polyphosphate:nucleotide phosphotransferase
MSFRAAPHPLLVPPGDPFPIATAATKSPSGGKSKDWKDKLESERKKLGDFQHKLYAHNRYAVLVIFQALDAAGKDGTIRHVFSGVNPTGLHVVSFKRPSVLELEHDFLWRTSKELPERGHIAVFNRSYYEEVLVVRVHPELLAAQQLPEPLPDTIWPDRLRGIRDHELHLASQGTVILKFWLNVSRDEQRRRFLERLSEPHKHWKFSTQDIDERGYWDAYMAAYEECLAATSEPWAPWYAIPADDKPYMRWQVAALINAALEQLPIDFPRPSEAELQRFVAAADRLKGP